MASAATEEEEERRGFVEFRLLCFASDQSVCVRAVGWKRG